MDMPAGADGTLMLARAGSTAAAVGMRPGGGGGGGAAGANGLAGQGSGFRGRVQEVVGVHGGDAHKPEDEQTRVVQVNEPLHAVFDMLHCHMLHHMRTCQHN